MPVFSASSWVCPLLPGPSLCHPLLLDSEEVVMALSIRAPALSLHIPFSSTITNFL
jgi:hypothetical protein